jgi:hypothetical protein
MLALQENLRGSSNQMTNLKLRKMRYLMGLELLKKEDPTTAYARVYVDSEKIPADVISELTAKKHFDSDDFKKNIEDLEKGVIDNTSHSCTFSNHSIFHRSAGNIEEGESGTAFYRVLVAPMIDDTTPNLANLLEARKFCRPKNSFAQITIVNGPVNALKFDESSWKIKEAPYTGYTVIYEIVGIGYHIDPENYQLLYRNDNYLSNDAICLKKQPK